MVVTDHESAQMRQLEDVFRNDGQVVVRKIQDSEMLETKDLIGDFGEAFVAEVEFPAVWVCGSHWDVLTLQGRTMEGSDVKQQGDAWVHTAIIAKGMRG